jgi:hypothetical protein
VSWTAAVAVWVLFSLFAARAAATDGVAPGTPPPPGTPMISCPGPYPPGFPAGSAFSYSANFAGVGYLGDLPNCVQLETVAADLTGYSEMSAQPGLSFASTLPVQPTPFDQTCTSTGGTAASPGAGQWTCSASQYSSSTGQVTAVYFDFSWPGAVTRSVCGRPRFYDGDPLNGWLWATRQTGVRLSCDQFAAVTYYLPQFVGQPVKQRQTGISPWPGGSLYLNGRTLGLRRGRYRCSAVDPETGQTGVELVTCTLLGHPQVRLSWDWDQEE